MTAHKKLFIGGAWRDTPRRASVRNPYNGDEIGTVAQADADDVALAVQAADAAVPTMAAMPAHRRADILLKIAAALEARREELARAITLESGKALKFSLAEVDRARCVFTIAAEEAKRIHGETLPLDAVPYAEGYFGFWLRKPVGVVAAITPFNFPLNLAAHKIAPAIAAGNTLVLKPAEQTPLTAAMLFEILDGAGLPAGAVNLVQGAGETVGDALARDPRVAKVSFTGSREVGALILARAGIKKVTLELGNASPVIVAPDADLDFAAARCAFGAFYNAGQVCVSVQRVYADRRVVGDFTERFARAADRMVVGDPLDAATDIGPMIHVREAERAEQWVEEAVNAGARPIHGGRREGALLWPALLGGAKAGMKVVDREVFAPVASVIESPDFEQALRMANATEYGLQAAVFTRDIERALRAVDALNFGGVIINDSPAFRADHMPYGGNRQSGLGREGLRHAIEEMTNTRMVVIRRDPPAQAGG